MDTRKKTALIAVAGLLAFYLLTKGLNALSSSPGANSYKSYCAKCHGEQGEGLGTLVPPLNNADWLKTNSSNLACVIRYGIKDSIQVNGQWYDEEMLGLSALSEVQIANICNYISSNFTETKHFYTPEEIENSLQGCKDEKGN
ncbi:MAG: c-type cytochrome [Chitinophagales bacterium]|nr:c-type cytochrome [Chitinophagales bacterium]